MTATVLQHVVNALAAARELPHAERTREVSLTITKLEEAALWLHANQVMVAAGITRPPDISRATAGAHEALAASIGGATVARPKEPAGGPGRHRDAQVLHQRPPKVNP